MCSRRFSVRPGSIRSGALCWVLAVQFFIAQVVAASVWTTPFSLSTRYISDLGNTACGPYPSPTSVVVCSPWHAVMNTSFIVVGITMAGGAILGRLAFARGWRRELATVLFVAAGAGVALVGIFPENEDIAWHAFGAGINFIGGNIAMMLYGWSPPPSSSPAFGRFSIVWGLCGLAGTVLFVVNRDLGLGPGGMERVAAYSTSTWQIVTGWMLWRRAPNIGRSVDSAGR